MDSFVASTQYTDMRGTVAVDESDHQPIHDFLQKQGRMSDGEYVGAISFFFHSPNFVHVHVFTTNLSDRKLIREASERGEHIHPGSLRKLELQVNLEQFFSFFKRFDIKILDKGFEGALDGINIDDIDES